MLISKTITGAMRMIGVLASGEVPSANEMEDALDTLNSFVDKLNSDGLSVVYNTMALYQPDQLLDPTLGMTVTITEREDLIPDPANPPQGFCYAPAPIQILTLSLVLNNNLYKVTAESIQQLMSTFQQTGIQGLPSKYVVNYGQQFTEITFNTQWDATYIISAFVKLPFDSLKATDDVTWNYGMERLLRTNLAVLLAPEYGKQIDPTIYKEAVSSLEELRARSLSVDTIDTPFSAGEINDTYDYTMGTGR